MTATRALWVNLIVISFAFLRNCHDSSAAESFFKYLKAELVWRRNWQTRREVENALFESLAASTIRAENTQRSAGNQPWPLN